MTDKSKIKTVPVRIPFETWRALKNLATNEETTMAELIREGIDLVFDDRKEEDDDG